MTEQVGEQVQETGGSEQEEVNVGALKERLDKLESYNEKLKAEAIDWRKKYKGHKAEVDETESKRMQESNDFKGLYEKAMDEIGNMKQTVAEKERTSLKNSFKYEAARHASDTVDPDLLIAALNTKKEVVAYDHEAGDWKGIDQAVNELRNEKPFLFKQEKPGMANGRPQGVPVKEQSIEEAIEEDSSGVLSMALEKLFTS
jgi:hypothetical protein